MKRNVLSTTLVITIILVVTLVIGNRLFIKGNATSLNQTKKIKVANKDLKQESEVWEFLIDKGVIPKKNAKFYKIEAKFIDKWAFVDVIRLDEKNSFIGLRPIVLKKENTSWLIFDGYNNHGDWEHTNEMPEDIKKAFNIWDGGHY